MCEFFFRKPKRNKTLMIIEVRTIFNQSGQFGHAVHVLQFRPSTFAKGLSKQRSCVNADRQKCHFTNIGKFAPLVWTFNEVSA